MCPLKLFVSFQSVVHWLNCYSTIWWEKTTSLTTSVSASHKSHLLPVYSYESLSLLLDQLCGQEGIVHFYCVACQFTSWKEAGPNSYVITKLETDWMEHLFGGHSCSLWSTLTQNVLLGTEGEEQTILSISNNVSWAILFLHVAWWFLLYSVFHLIWKPWEVELTFSTFYQSLWIEGLWLRIWYSASILCIAFACLSSYTTIILLLSAQKESGGDICYWLKTFRNALLVFMRLVWLNNASIKK